jgi:hypothetical protein
LGLNPRWTVGFANRIIHSEVGQVDRPDEGLPFFED